MDIIFLRQAHKFIRHSCKGLKEKIKEECLSLQKNPYTGEKLKGRLKEIYSHHFSHDSVQYRIAYKINLNMIIITIGTRENFYKDIV